MYEVVILNSAAKQLRNLDKPIKNKIIIILEKIAENPFVGERLKGNLTAIYSYHLKIASVEYRIAYQIKEQEIIIVIMQIGTRENFYEELKKRV
ncbi:MULTISPECIES: type II toxin-antitoxin system RelE/ParE family toxin [Pelosinus]|jgi:mRNA interferase RelE/StbE|uniref:Plasmid stabilization system n=1 Tax=Pelosinus fermentans B4 TaxID=1149862 RepID=I9LEE9_9FIRM|nr:MULTISPECIES: type II toxin-antitoxin system RelE/ParE family toxin [Pelosinus]EIW18741.1 plasmid stabilization system [Pelosinus fermentans B4]EIW22049.1 addiction module toxin, RelE/StbE family [Pelosinus fermentans A11]OAM95098.1 plasmid stabilization system [Pelosinus fermentans DSM 17108]SDR23289.1 ParE-like toxin of type II toxin-antitoxin system [Pelosinus fermentans]